MWNGDRNKLRYIDLFQAITEIRTIHPNWEIDLSRARNSHLCKCCSCLVERKPLLDNRDLDSENSDSDEGSKNTAH